MFDPDWDSNDLFRQLWEERALVDDLFDTLSQAFVLLGRLGVDVRKHPELSAAFDRYRQARGR
jgi:hypothetical protein